MVNPERQDINQLKREVAQLRGELAMLRSALALGPDETLASMAGRIRRQLDDAGTVSQQAMNNIYVLFQNTVLQSNRSDAHDQRIAALEHGSSPQIAALIARFQRQVDTLQQQSDVIDTAGGLSLSMGIAGSGNASSSPQIPPVTTAG
jgi:ribosomal protein L29